MQRHNGANSCVPLDDCFPFGVAGDESTRPRRAKEAFSALARMAETEQLWNGHYASDVRLKALDKSEWRPNFRGLLLLVPCHSCQRCGPLHRPGLVREWKSSASTSFDLPQDDPLLFLFVDILSFPLSHLLYVGIADRRKPPKISPILTPREYRRLVRLYAPSPL
jgi:hypothetical protein